MKAFKGFNNDLTCRGFKFQEGKTFEEENADLCRTGFHACEYPLDCFNYYHPAESVFHTVELDNVSDQREADTKIVGKKITIGARVDFAGLVSAAVQYTIDRTHKVDGGHSKDNQGAAINTGDQGAASNTGDQGAASNTGDHGAASNTGDQGAASNTGDRGAASNTGYQGAASNTGDQGAASNTGDRGAASNTGYQGAASNTGYQGAASNTGYHGAASNTGYQGAASNTGDHGVASNTGYQGAASSDGANSIAVTVGTKSTASVTSCSSIACALGKDSHAKGVLHSWIVLAERGEWNGHAYPIMSVMAREVDGEAIKPDVFYKLVNGVVVEA